jgi:transposase-like protein
MSKRWPGRWELHRASLYNWFHQFSAKSENAPGEQVAPMAPEAVQVKRLQARVVELESAVGRRQVQIDFFQDALRRVEAAPPASPESGGTPSTK